MKKGFTLIELMIVVVIIGILAAIAIPKFTSVKEQAEMVSCQSNMRTLATAETMYYGVYDRYTAAYAELDEMQENASLLACPSDPAAAQYGLAITPPPGATYTISCAIYPGPGGDPLHGTVDDGITSWQ
jgi:prepilin-type N-terminal cleavage/methylation domain-containing protein